MTGAGSQKYLLRLRGISEGHQPTTQLPRIQSRKMVLQRVASGGLKAASPVAFSSLIESELAKTESTYLAEMHRQSPKEKASKTTTVRRRKRPHAHLRVPHLEEVMSPVTTPTDEDVGHRIKHVAGVCQVGTGGVN